MSEESYSISPIARIRTDFKTKFGIPRQSGLVPELTSEAAKMASLGAGAKVIKNYSFQLTEDDLEEVRQYESALDVEGLIAKALQGVERITISMEG